MTDQQVASEVTRCLNFLAAIPLYGNTTCERPVLRAIMLRTGGYMLAQGYQWDIKSKSLGGGVYRLSLEKQ